MLSETDARNAMGQTLYDSEGEKVGKVGQVYLDDTSGEPEFLTVNTGLFGTNESFVPAQQATAHEDGYTVPFAKDVIKDAPNVAADGHLDVADEQRLYEYYGMSGTQTSEAVGQAAPSGSRTDARTESEGHDTSGPTTDEAMTRSEEQLQVGTHTEDAGRARLRKYVTTEEQTVTVPVSKEYAVLETETITDANRDDALGGPDISSEEHEVLLNEEVVDVNKTVKPVERVRLGTETRTEEQTVTDEVRKEHVEVDGDVEDRRV